ncbi:MAG: hypothetical protein AUJ74_03640 [Candidatus Omnitrophica bacterium CG1_02_44_16]|nr:MAG: hypothetical protein AUJ74_03640 [Candidatus Omnitrophica bacterium CG1_02_44_16]PIY82620.1 MAG: hypothetical protein COY78_05835 [Candidatus Omnitrophica bacterium CG_4_10_14_0_8_um_filter_44_12]PIZ83341.1 MAG: hypothetical protein COX96_08300 [Candidatus Omnitrophica bacterium CG_4_10_14_0_2_um_filter_44_9]
MRSLIDAAMAKLELLADQDALRLQVFKLSSRAGAIMTKYQMDGDAEKAREKFSMKDGQKVGGLDPMDSEGAAFLAETEDVWEKSQLMFDRIYQLLDKSNDPGIRQGIDEFKKSVQDNILFYERIQKEAKVSLAQALEQVQLKKIHDEFALIRKEMDLKKLAASLEVFKRSLSTQTFSFIGQQTQAILAEVLKIENDVHEKLEMAGLSGGSAVKPDKEGQVAAAVTALANAYEKNDISGSSGLISRDFLGNKAAFEEGARFDFGIFSGIRLSLSINRIMEQGGMMAAYIRWDKAQTARHSSGEQKTNGMTTLIFVEEDGIMKLKSLKGNLIFATLSTDIAQDSGLGFSVIDEIRAAHDAREPKQPGAAFGSGVGFDKNGQVAQEPTLPKLLMSQGSRRGEIPQLHMGFDFSTGMATSAGVGDFTMLGGVLQGQGGAKIREAGMDFSSITQAPASGYSDPVLLNDNAAYCFITKEGYYGKMKIGAVMGVHFVFEYVLASDVTKNLVNR